MIAVCILLIPNKDTVVKSSWSEDDMENFFWELGKKNLLSNAKALLEKLKNYDKNNIDPFCIKRIKEYVLNHSKRGQKWEDDEMKTSNKANYYLFLFVNSILMYHEFYEKTKPLRQKYDDCM